MSKMNMLPVEEWFEKHFPGLHQDIVLHIKNSAPDRLDRMILISIRERIYNLAGKTTKPFGQHRNDPELVLKGETE